MGYTVAMDPKEVRGFVERDRASVEWLKREYHARRARLDGPSAGLRLSQQLRDQVRSVIPGWPTSEDRAADLDHHVRLKQKLDRAARGLAGR
jgi:hypothetical protein